MSVAKKLERNSTSVEMEDSEERNATQDRFLSYEKKNERVRKYPS